MIPSHETISRLPASRFPDPAEVYYCDNCGRDLTKNLHRDRAPVWQPLRPMWYVCECGRKYLSGAAEWDDLPTWERRQRVRQLAIGLVLFALLVVPVTLAYFALSHGGAALLAVVGIALIPSILAAKPFWFVLVDLYEITISIWRTRVAEWKASSGTAIKQWLRLSRLQKFRLSPVAAVIALLIVATHWIPSHHSSASPMAASSSEASNSVPQAISFPPAKLPLSSRAQALESGAPSRAFRRVQVGPNEVDYVSEDVTVRHFVPTPRQSRGQVGYKEVRIGPDVTVRYFASNPAAAPRAQLVSIDGLPLSQ